MARYALTVRELGEAACWLLARQAVGIRDAGEYTDFMQGRTAVLIFYQEALPERLCVTAAVRQMSGFVVYESPSARRREELTRYKRQILPVFDYFVDCLYIYGIPVCGISPAPLDIERVQVKFPIINAGGPDAHPVHALADVACMLRGSGDLREVTAAWIGCANGTLCSLIEATAFFPFALRISLPPFVDAAPMREAARRLRTPVTFTDSPEEALRGADYIFAGCSGEMSGDEAKVWRLDARLMALAAEKARVMLSASPIDVIAVDDEIFASPASLLRRQAEYRLRVHKRMLHWVFLEDDFKI
ncbi:MAG: ornithine carbamoyltransferase [Desulfovibrio sp.]|nr:ornithine carbamoyltransferase [Desulfovibrio sp.]